MAHHWIVDESADKLTTLEKLVMVVIERWQFHGNQTGISQEKIAEGASCSVRAVQKAIKSAEAKGYPIVARRDCKGNATHYLVKQMQAMMFSNACTISRGRNDARTKTPGTSPSLSVENSVENAHAAGVSGALSAVSGERGSPESLFEANDVRTLSVTSSVNTNSKPGAAAPPPSAFCGNLKIKDPEVARRISEHFEHKKEQADREALAALAKRLGRVPHALTEEEYRARQALLAKQRDEVLEGRAVAVTP